MQAVELSPQPDPGMGLDNEDLVVELGHVVALAGELLPAAATTRMLRPVDGEHRLLLPRRVVATAFRGFRLAFPVPRDVPGGVLGRIGVGQLQLPLLDEILGGGCEPRTRGHLDRGAETRPAQLVAEFRLGDDGHSPDSQSAGKVT